MTHALAAAGTNADSVAVETVFWILAVVSCSAALAMILVRRAVHCALMLAVVMLCLATMYACKARPFLAFAQIIRVHRRGAHVFLFVLIVVGITRRTRSWRPSRPAAGRRPGRDRPVRAPGPRHRACGHRPAAAPSTAYTTDNLTGLATLIFTTYVFRSRSPARC